MITARRTAAGNSVRRWKENTSTRGNNVRAKFRSGIQDCDYAMTKRCIIISSSMIEVILYLTNDFCPPVMDGEQCYEKFVIINRVNVNKSND